MRLHYLQHASFETPGTILDWAKASAFEVTATRLYAQERLPYLDDVDWLVVMGGPMNIYQDDEYPWLPAEKAFIRSAIDAGKVVVGVCLGAQFVADALGAKVMPNTQKEIGWFTVRLTPDAAASAAFSKLPTSFTALHWHGDTFDIPAGAARMAFSEATANQAFQLGKRVFAVQFHLECTAEALADLAYNGESELVPGPWVQSAEELLNQPVLVGTSERLMGAFLDGVREEAGVPAGA